MGIASLIKKMLGESTSMHCIKKAILYSGDNDVNHINDVPNSPDQKKIKYVQTTLHRGYS
jgi:hypothetical protein